jgi:hypothetical protein
MVSTDINAELLTPEVIYTTVQQAIISESCSFDIEDSLVDYTSTDVKYTP